MTVVALWATQSSLSSSLGLGLRLSNNTQECVGTFDDSSGLCCMGKDIVVLFAIGRT